MADRGCIIFLILLSNMLMIFVGGRGVKFMKSIDQHKHKGTVKTIESDDGDVIDCVDIKRQPAFDHPLMQNHTIQMKPHAYSSGMKTENNGNVLFQSWHKNGECPEGSIPIIRTQHFNLSRRISPAFLKKNQLDVSTAVSSKYEFAQMVISEGKYYGTRATINVWNPVTNANEFSTGQVWMMAGSGNEINSLEAGWMVQNGEKQTKLFVYWTRDNFGSTGCYNLLCSGFVQTSSSVALGATLGVSTYGGPQYVIEVVIQKGQKDGNWWLQVTDQVIGYWPGSIFTHLADAADEIAWGGEVLKQAAGRGTSTQMGSGHFPIEEAKRAAFFNRLGYLDDSGDLFLPQNPKLFVTNSKCYDLIPTKNYVSFYYGGPGCP